MINVVTKRPRDLGTVQLTAEGSVLPPQGVDGAPQLRWPGFGGTGRASLLAGHEATFAGQPLEVSLAAEYYAHRGQSLTFAVQDGLTESDGQRSWPQRWGPHTPPGTWGGTTTDSWSTQAASSVLKLRWGDLQLWARGALFGRNSSARDEFGLAGNFDDLAHETDRWLDLEVRWARTLSPRWQVMVRGYFDVYDYLLSFKSSSWFTFGSGNALPGDSDPANFTFRSNQHGASRWGGLEVQTQHDWLGDGRFPLMAGVDLRLRHFEADTSYLLNDAVFDTSNAYQASEWQIGVYLQQRARVFSVLQLNVGARLDLQAGFEPRVSPRAALVWALPWEGRLKAVFSSAFRAPSGFERLAEFPGLQIQNPSLRAESVQTGELSYEQRVGRQHFAFGAFTSRFLDTVRYLAVPTDTDLSWYANGTTLVNAGGYAVIDGAWGHFGYGASFTGAANWADEPLVASPSWFGNARVSWDFGEGLPRASLLTAFSGPRLITAAQNTGVDAEGATLRWDPASTTVGPQVELRASVDSKVSAVRGLWVRGVVGGNLTPFSAYTVGPRQAPEPGHTVPSQAPNSRLFVMLTVGWSLDAL